MADANEKPQECRSATENQLSLEFSDSVEFLELLRRQSMKHDLLKVEEGRVVVCLVEEEGDGVSEHGTFEEEIQPWKCREKPRRKSNASSSDVDGLRSFFQVVAELSFEVGQHYREEDGHSSYST